MTLEQAMRGALLIDGGLGTELERAGCDLSSPLWSAQALLADPVQVVRVHKAYLEAGAECITTASYQISVEGFRRGPFCGRGRSGLNYLSAARSPGARPVSAES